MSFMASKMFYVCRCISCICMCVCIHTGCLHAYVHSCMHTYLQNVAIRTLKTPTNLKVHVVPCFYFFYIGTLVVVENRDVIERQSHVCIVVVKQIIRRRQALRKVCRQKYCHPAPNHHLIFFESASCKNSETSCLESRRKFDGAELIRIR